MHTHVLLHAHTHVLLHAHTQNRNTAANIWRGCRGRREITALHVLVTQTDMRMVNKGETRDWNMKPAAGENPQHHVSPTAATLHHAQTPCECVSVCVCVCECESHPLKRQQLTERVSQMIWINVEHPHRVGGGVGGGLGVESMKAVFCLFLRPFAALPFEHYIMRQHVVLLMEPRLGEDPEEARSGRRTENRQGRQNGSTAGSVVHPPP